ncbi:Uncharacterised protein [Escherichia coli]|uniref:Uncharacterized protein n=1 Tax=Escherichia coli TaxID=562 RepID=A0ABD7W3E4_ECOLX|nr:Uncharacterised protein [Escherichia coli]
MLLQQGAAIIDALAVDQRGQVIPDRRGEFRLCVQQSEHARVRRESGGDLVETVGADALGCGGGLQARQAAAEHRIVAGGRGRRQRRGRREGGRQAERGQNGHGVLRVAVARPS